MRALRESGVTIILTTHYIEEAEEMADRIGVINNGELDAGRREGRAHAQARQEAADAATAGELEAIPPALARHGLTLGDEGMELIYTYDTQGERTGITSLLKDLASAGIRFRDLQTTQTSLEDIFVELVRQDDELEAVRAIYDFEMARTGRTHDGRASCRP